VRSRSGRSEARSLRVRVFDRGSGEAGVPVNLLGGDTTWPRQRAALPRRAGSTGRPPPPRSRAPRSRPPRAPGPRCRITLCRGADS
jgi:hypothetical protein